jgi:hypothetical protein
MIVWTVAVRSCEEAIQYRKGMGTETTHCRVGPQGMTCSTRWAAIWAMRRPAHDGQNPRRCAARPQQEASAAPLCVPEGLQQTSQRLHPSLTPPNLFENSCQSFQYIAVH